MPSTNANLHVGMISLTDPDDPNRVSGMPHRMSKALREQGIRITPIIADRSPDTSRLARIYRRRVPDRTKRIADTLFPTQTQRALWARAARLTAAVHEQLEELTTDHARTKDRTPNLLFGVCVAIPLAQLETDLPIVYFSDATTPIINATYPIFSNRGPALLNTRIEIERAALTRVTRAAFASPAARDSAINDLGLPADLASVIPMGAHISPTDPSSINAPASPPTARDCRLLIVAADPQRKRVDLAVRATESLRRAGINATLSVIGPGTKLARKSPAVDLCKPLQLSNPEHAAEHRRLLHASHIQLLPSVGEAFGIAPTESAHFARPSIVSDTGGLPSVVRHDDTGLVIPVTQPHQTWANAIADLVNDPDRYRRYSSAARARARVEFTWSAWATKTIALMHQAVADTPRRIGTDSTITPTRSAG